MFAGCSITADMEAAGEQAGTRIEQHMGFTGRLVVLPHVVSSKQAAEP